MLAVETPATETPIYLPPTDIGDVSRWPSESTPAVSDRVQAKWSQTQVPRSSPLSTEHHQRGGRQGAVQGSAPAHAERRAVISHVFPDVRNRLRNADGQRQDETRWAKENNSHSSSPKSKSRKSCNLKSKKRKKYNICLRCSEVQVSRCIKLEILNHIPPLLICASTLNLSSWMPMWNV